LLGKAAAGLAGLGLIGGTVAVIHNQNGDETVKIKNDTTGQVQTVRISGAGGKPWSCPADEDSKLDPYTVRAGRIKLTLQQVRRVEHQLFRQYPKGAPHRVVVRFNALHLRDGRLVDAYNAQVAEHNAIIRRDCSPAG
jgi:hypothetical protein